MTVLINFIAWGVKLERWVDPAVFIGRQTATAEVRRSPVDRSACAKIAICRFHYFIVDKVPGQH